jgi:hypothetical protein
MVQRCQHLRFASKSRHTIGVADEGIGEDFDGNVAIEFVAVAR